MKPSFLASASVILLLTPAEALIGPAVVHRQTACVVCFSEAREHLEEMSEKWNQLKEKEKQIEKSQDPAAAMDFAVEMLETAIEHVHTKEEVEEEHVASVHDALMKVLAEESALETAANVVQRDAEDAESILNNYDKGGLPEDREQRRELTVADLAHTVEDYVEERLHQAKTNEMQMREEEDAAQQELNQLKWNEGALKEVLGELKALKKDSHKDELKQ